MATYDMQVYFYLTHESNQSSHTIDIEHMLFHPRLTLNSLFQLHLDYPIYLIGDQTIKHIKHKIEINNSNTINYKQMRA